LLALICRSHGDLSANEKEGKKASNINDDEHPLPNYRSALDVLCNVQTTATTTTTTTTTINKQTYIQKVTTITNKLSKQ